VDVIELTSAIVTEAGYDGDEQTIIGAVYDRSGRLVRQSQRPRFGAWRHADPQAVDLPTGYGTLAHATYVGRFHAHFGHFLIETLPSLFQHRLSTSVLAHPWPDDFREEAIPGEFRGYLLMAAGIDHARIRLVDRPLVVGHLLVPPHLLSPIAGVASQALVHAYRRIGGYTLARAKAGSPRVYLSRRLFTGGSERYVINETEVETEFRSRGFEVIHPERLPIEAQIRAVASADHLAGCEGSAMLLGGFMRSGSSVIVIESRRDRSAKVIYDAIGLTTHRLEICAVEFDGSRQNVTVDLEALGARLDAVGLVPST
jgi:capsular polysaccharide biosynthesis protein